MDSNHLGEHLFEEKGDDDEQHSEPEDENVELPTEQDKVVKWWNGMVEKARDRHLKLREELGAPPFRSMNCKFKEQLRVGHAVHFATCDGVCTKNAANFSELQYPRIRYSHSLFLRVLHVRDATRVAEPKRYFQDKDKDKDKEWVFPQRLRVEEAWRVMQHYDASNLKDKRWRYHPGDVVEVRGLDMRWHMGVVTFARGFQDESREEKHTRIKERLSRASSQLLTRKASQSEAEEVVNENADNGDDDHDGDEEDDAQLVNVVRPNGRIDVGNDANEVRVPADAVRLLFGKTPFLWQQV